MQHFGCQKMIRLLHVFWGRQNQTLAMIYAPDYCILLQSCSLHTSTGNSTVSYEIT